MTEVEILWEKYVAMCDFDKKAFADYTKAHKKTNKILKIRGALSNEFEEAYKTEEKLNIRLRATSEAREMFFNKWIEANLAELRAEESETINKED